MRSSDGEGRSIRSDALYPALSGEWEVPVTRNAKITLVNEGGRVGGVVAAPSGITFSRGGTGVRLAQGSNGGSPVTRNAEI